jgi:TolA-binding protein
MVGLALAGPAAAQQESPEVMLQKGLQLFVAGQYQDAAPLFEQLISTFGNEPELKQALEQVYYALGSSYYNLQRFEDAVKTYAEYTRRYPETKFYDEALFRSGAARQVRESYEEAVAVYQRLLAERPRSDYAEDAAFQIGICHFVRDDHARVIEAFTDFTRNFPQSALGHQARMFMARAYFETGDPSQALTVLESMDSGRPSLDHVVYVNFLAIEIGDQAFENTDYDMALRAYRRVRTRQSLLRLQRNYVKTLEAAHARMQRETVDPRALATRFRDQRRLQTTLGSAREMLQKLEGMPEYDAGLFHRIGSCYFSTDQLWEARVAFQRVADQAADVAIQEAAHFDLILVLARLRRFDDLVREADRYLARFGKNAKYVGNGRVATIAFIRAESYINQERFEEAEVEMRKLLDQHALAAQKPRVEFYLALCAAMLERFGEGIEAFRRWRTDHPDHILKTEVEYWLPIALFYDGQYAAARPLFQEYAARYPAAVYAPEAAYRAALCMYSLEEYEDCAAALGQWINDFPDHYFRWEALVTRGDSLAALGRLEEARDAYKRVNKDAGAFYFFALTQAVKVYKALDTEADYRDMAKVFGQYITDFPEAPNIVDAAYQAGWALRKIGRQDEARRFYWSIVTRHGNNRGWEGFEQILRDLRSMYPGEDGPALLEADFDREYRKAMSEDRPTLAARLTQARLPPARDPERAAALLDFSTRFKPAVLGSESLALLGEHFLQTGKAERGFTYLDKLIEDFPQSRHAAVAYARQAEQRLKQKEHEAALGLAEQAIARAWDPVLLLEATFTRAQCLQALQRYDDAVEAYNMVIANRVSPRHLKPQAMIGVAECLEARGDYRKAIPYYQRIYVLYQAYTNSVAAAYLKSGQAFEKLNDVGSAQRTYREMLADDALSRTPEADQARVRLAKLQS